MPLLQKIVEQINVIIKSSLNTKALQKNELLGIADKYIDDSPEENTAVPIRPMIMDDFGDCKPVESNDGHNLKLYHRILTNQYTDDTTMVRGDDKGRICNTEMILVVTANRKHLKLSAVQLESLIESVFPQTITKALRQEVKLYKCNIILLGSTFDQLQVFAGEYTNVPFFIKPHQAFFSIRYRIQSYFFPGCFQDCCTE